MVKQRRTGKRINETKRNKEASKTKTENSERKTEGDGRW